MFTTLARIFVLLVGTVEGRERGESFVLLMSVKCVGKAVSVLLILGDEIVELGW